MVCCLCSVVVVAVVVVVFVLSGRRRDQPAIFQDSANKQLHTWTKVLGKEASSCAFKTASSRVFLSILIEELLFSRVLVLVFSSEI